MWFLSHLVVVLQRCVCVLVVMVASTGTWQCRGPGGVLGSGIFETVREWVFFLFNFGPCTGRCSRFPVLACLERSTAE